MAVNRHYSTLIEIFIYYISIIMLELLISSILYLERITIVHSTFLNIRNLVAMFIFIFIYFSVILFSSLDHIVDMKNERKVLHTFIHLLNTYSVSLRTVNFESMPFFKFFIIFFSSVLIITYLFLLPYNIFDLILCVVDAIF